jgi:diguanylate cyclase (GGDEF)-like protein
MGRLRRYVWLIGSLMVVLVLAVVAVGSEQSSASAALSTQSRDRQQQQRLLSGLAGQYLDFTLLATQTAARGGHWQLRAGSASDEAQLAQFVTTSPLTDYGAALVTLAGQTLAAYPSSGALPAATDPGYVPLRASLAAGRPGVSSLMSERGSPLVAFAVPVEQHGVPAALLVAYANARTWPLEGYVQRLRLGVGADAITTDSSGDIAAASQARLIGTRAAGSATLLRLAHADRAAVVSLGSGRTFLSAGDAGVGGWLSATEQPEGAFVGALPARHDQDVLALLALLITAMVLIVVWHTRRQQALQKLADARLYDPLTGLGQRALFHDRLATALARQQRNGTALALLYLDLDRFKAVNDTLGHHAGDQLLATVAERLRAAARLGDTVARLGGDEFAVLVEGVPDVSFVAEMAARLRAAVGAPCTVAGHPVQATVSVGGAVLLPGAPADDLLPEADIAMYRAKASGSGHQVTEIRSRPPGSPPSPRAAATATAPHSRP